jgi:hypothetical protein
MTNQIVAFAQAQAKTAVRRVAVPTAFALAGGLFLLFAIVGLFFALFFWLEPQHGPAAASLIVAAVALGLALVAFLPVASGAGLRPRLHLTRCCLSSYPC